jgi:hypothetical protein
MIRINNVHERELKAPLEKVGQLLDSLASKEDQLWPKDRWPAMRFDRPLQVDADGGHGPIRYNVESYEPGQNIWFRLKAPRGFNGGHGCEIIETGNETVVLRHRITMRISGPALLTWPLVIRPLHNALLEDALDLAECYCDPDAQPRSHWSSWVRFLRWALRPRR